MKKESPKLKILTDDNKSMNSCLEGTVSKTLGLIKLKHIHQNSMEDDVYVFTHHVDALIKFLTDSKKWIESDYKDEFKPESYTETGTEFFK